MQDKGHMRRPLDEDAFMRSQGQLRQLKDSLPPSSVDGLAREVIRRLAEQHTGPGPDGDADDAIERLCLALLSEDDRAGLRFVQELFDAGASLEDVYLRYLAEAARMLGVWWDESRASFAEVTLGTSRMYAILAALRHERINRQAAERYAVFVSVPGDTHTLGVRMAADLFRAEGWQVDLKIGLDHDDLVAEIRRSGAPVVGVSAAGQHALPALTRLVVALRVVRPEASLFVGGHIVEDAREPLSLLDVDGMANDIPTAKSLMRGLWRMSTGAV